MATGTWATFSMLLLPMGGNLPIGFGIPLDKTFSHEVFLKKLANQHGTALAHHVDTWLKVHGATAGSSPVLLPFYLQPPSACMESTERGTTHSPQPQHIICSSPLCLPGTPMAGHPPSSLQLHSAPACPSANSSSQLLHDGLLQKTKPSFPRPWDYWPSWHQIIFLDTASATLPLKSGALA